MALWGYDDSNESKPKWAANNENCYADERGWILKHPWGEEVLVCISGLNDSLANPNILSMSMTPGPYVTGDDIEFTLVFNEVIDSASGEELTLTLSDSVEGGSAGDVVAPYVSGEGTNEITFGYTVQSGDSALADSGGLTIPTTAPDYEIEDFDFESVPGSNSAFPLEDLGIYVNDTVAATVDSLSTPEAEYNEGDTIPVTIEMDKICVVDTSGGTPYVPLYENDGTTLIGNALYASGSETTDLIFEYVVQSGDAESTGVKAGADITLDGGVIEDLAENEADVSFDQVTLTNVTIVT